MNTLIGYSKCSTCQNAKRFLENHQISYTFRDIKEDRLNEEELQRILKQSSLPIKAFFNTRGQLYKALKLKDTISTMSEQEQIQLLAGNGMLVKRPILVNEHQVLVGFKEDDYKTLL